MATLTIVPPKEIQSETAYSGSVIARKNFNLTVRALKSSGQVDTGYSGTVTVYANSQSSDTAFVLGKITLSRGQGSGYMNISSVYGTGASRKITVIDGSGAKASVNVAVWFQGKASEFNDSSVACGGTPPSRYAALPKKGLCDTNIIVINPSNGKKSTAPKKDVGPWVPCGNCPEDPYWNTGTVPWATTNNGKDRSTLCGSSSCKYKVNGAIIDLSTKMMDDLGVSGSPLTRSISNAVWRFS